MELSPDLVLWEDREIKFDTLNLINNLRRGEKILDLIQHIEDTKGNPGDSGRLVSTNLRIIWHSLVHKKFNLSIGYGRIATANVRTLSTKTRGIKQALYILATGGKTRFEFLFSDISEDKARRNQQIYKNFFEIYALYQRTFLYRDLKLRGNILLSGQLIIMPEEFVYRNINGVWNLSSDQGNLGSFYITNIRLVWFADANETFNISLPYLQISSLRIRESKYGPALVIQTTETGGSYVLGFRIDPSELLNEIYTELSSLHKIHTENPNFGIHMETIETQRRQAQAALDELDDLKIEEFKEIDDRQEREINSKLNTYLAEGCLIASQNDNDVMNEKTYREPVYCKELGFAMERIPDGYKLKDLWDVIPVTMNAD